MLYVVEVVIYWLCKARHSWKLWWLPSAILGSPRKLDRRSYLRDEGLSDPNRFLTLLHSVDFLQVPLLQSHGASCDGIRSNRRTGPNENFVWSDRIRSEPYTLDASRRGRRQTISSSFCGYAWETVPLSFYSVA